MVTPFRLSAFISIIFFMLSHGGAFSAEPLTVYTADSTVKVTTAGGQSILDLGLRLWGPNWAWTGFEGRFRPEGNSAVGDFSGNIGGTNVPFTFRVKVTPQGKRRMTMEGEFKTQRDSGVHMAGLGISFGAPLQGSERGTVTDASGSRKIDLPLGIGSFPEPFRKVVMTDAGGKAYSITFAEPISASHHGEIRATLAADEIKGGDVKKFSLTLDLPEDAAFYLSPEATPDPEGWENWFPWEATADTATPSVIDASSLLEAPAGKHGRIVRKADRLIYNGKPIKIWGVNTCYSGIASPKDVSDARAAFYAKYGINAVRLHKFADGPDWDGVLDHNSYTKYNPEKLALMDYYVAKLKEKGIYVKLSANFGRARVYRDDVARVPYAKEFGDPSDRGIIEPGGGAIFLSTELQDIQIEQLVNLLKHKNAETGMTYAQDPCVMTVELVNEDSALFYGTMGAMNRSATLKARAGKNFAAWLKKKYKTEAKLTEAWGDALNALPGEGATDEAFNNGDGPVYPVGNPWFYDPDQTDGGMMSARRQRLLDTMLFWYEQQNAFYDRFVAAIRATGYEGEILGSNWQAGRATSHFLNLHSDYRVGLIDRHNYFGGASSMLAVPGSGILSTGMQQVADRPFMLSEWIHTFPSEYCAEGPAIIGAYGMGLNGWDVSFMFQNGDDGHFRDRLGQEWDIVAPQVLGLFPAVARQVIREDVKASDLVFSRNVDLKSLYQGKLNFNDKVEQGYDVKNFSSDVTPVEALAVGRVVVDFVPEAKATKKVDLSKFVKDGAFLSSTKELAWTPGGNPRDGHFTVNTPRTQAVVGFTHGKAVQLADVAVRTQTPYAVIYVTSLDGQPIATSKHLLITTIARARNTGMKLVGGELLAQGTGPILMEPVACELMMKRTGTPKVYVLDHDGRRTEKTVSPTGNRMKLDGGQTRAVYYEVVY